MNTTLDISVVIPLYNEEEAVNELYKRLTMVLGKLRKSYEIIFVEDGSTDNTFLNLKNIQEKDHHIKLIKLRGNFGQTSAMVAGFDHSLGEIIVTMDGDLQNDPSDIPMLLKKMEEGYDIVSGWRKDRKDKFSRVLPSRVANAIISLTTGVHLHDYGCSLKAYRAECIKTLNAYGEMHRFFPALASMTGARVTEVPVNHHSRKYGVSKYGFDRIFKVFSDIFAMNLIIRFSSSPLKGFTICALPFLFITFGFGILSVLAEIFKWTSGKALFFMIATSLSGMAVIHLMVMGILGELVVSTSDLTHTRMPALTKKKLQVNTDE